MRVPLIYKTAPIFGFDIGSRTVKLVQIQGNGHKFRVLGYGTADFPADAIIEGIISDPEALAKGVRGALQKLVAGHISAQRVNVALPAAKVFIRTLQLPPMSQGDLEQAIRFEAEQYVPVPVTDLYIDYNVISSDTPEHTNVLMVAAPRAIVDSYIKLFDYLNLEIESIETSLSALTRSLNQSGAIKGTALVVDFGSRSADMVVFKDVIRLTGTMPVGGDDLTQIISKTLNITPDQANEIKYKFGIGPSGIQAKIADALEPSLKTMVAEIKKILKFYDERSEKKDPVAAIVLTGGAANLPGLQEYLKKQLELPISVGNPWSNLSTNHLPPVDKFDAPMYATAIGLAMRGEQ